MNDTTKMLLCECRPELNPSLSNSEELEQMDRQSAICWGLGWWQSEAIKQAASNEVLRMENERLRELLARSMDNSAAYYSKPRDW